MLHIKHTYFGPFPSFTNFAWLVYQQILSWYGVAWLVYARCLVGICALPWYMLLNSTRNDWYIDFNVDILKIWCTIYQLGREMGGVITVVQAVLAVGFVAEGITQIVLREKLKAILKEHQDQFKLMDDLYKFVGQILGQKNLVSQLNANVLFATDNWNTIFNDLEDKNDLLKKIIGSFPNVKTSNFDYTISSGIMFSASILLSGYISYNFISGNAKAEIKSNVASFKEFCKATSAKIRGRAPENQSSKVSQDGSITVQSHGTSAAEIPPQARVSEVQNVKVQEKSGWKSRVVTALRLVFVAVAIYGFFLGVIGLIQLSKQLKTYDDYFKAEGEFEQAEDGVLQLMNLVAADIFNLSNCSQAAFYDTKNMFLVKSITIPLYHQETLKYAKQLNAEDYGLDFDFIYKSKDLINNCNTVVQSGKSRKDKLGDLKGYFKYFWDLKKPAEVFLNISMKLSEVVGKYSLISQGIVNDQNNVNRFLNKVGDCFQDYRDENFPSKSPEQKKKIDTGIMSKVFEKYKKIFDLNQNLKIQQIDPKTEAVIFSVIASYTDTDTDGFYYDSDGTTLFGKNIKASKSEVNYKTMMEQDLSKANVIPVSLSKPADEQKEIDAWLNIAKETNEKENCKYWPKDLTPQANYRYIRLQVDKITDPKGKQYGTLVSFEGLNMKLKLGGKFFNCERSVLKNTVTLREG